MLCLLLLIAVALLSVKLSCWEHRIVREKQRWLVCTRVNMDILRDITQGVARTNASPDVVNLAALARAGVLPEWSGIYICPAWFDIDLPRQTFDQSYRSNLFSPELLAAHYSKSSYYLEHYTNGFRVRCLYHTNVLDYVVNVGH